MRAFSWNRQRRCDGTTQSTDIWISIHMAEAPNLTACCLLAQRWITKDTQSSPCSKKPFVVLFGFLYALNGHHGSRFSFWLINRRDSQRTNNAAAICHIVVHMGYVLCKPQLLLLWKHNAGLFGRVTTHSTNKVTSWKIWLWQAYFTSKFTSEQFGYGSKTAFYSQIRFRRNQEGTITLNIQISFCTLNSLTKKICLVCTEIRFLLIFHQI